MPIHNKATTRDPGAFLQVWDQEMQEPSVHMEQQEQGVRKRHAREGMIQLIQFIEKNIHCREQGNNLVFLIH